MPRALELFRRAGLAALPVPAASPRGPLRTAAWRAARERAALLLDRWLAPSWLGS
jgi:uncharacterized SAM-binding protein YcdF (DUF218 family)